jgi:hypothetical protein
MGTLTGDASGGLVLSTTIPDDGTLIKAADVNVPFEVAFNGLAYLGARGLLARYTYSYDDDTTLVAIETFSGLTYASSTTVLLNVPGLSVGDVVLVDVCANVNFNAIAGPEHFGDLRLAATQGLGGVIPTAAISGARAYLKGTASTTVYYQFSLSAEIVVTTAGTAQISLQGRVTTSGDSLQIFTAARIRALHLRKVV